MLVGAAVTGFGTLNPIPNLTEGSQSKQMPKPTWHIVKRSVRSAVPVRQYQLVQIGVICGKARLVHHRLIHIAMSPIISIEQVSSFIKLCALMASF